MKLNRTPKLAIAGLVALLGLPVLVFAQPVPNDLDTDQISEKTDEELTALTARWGELSAGERRTVLREVRHRMRASVNASANASARAKANYEKQLRAQGSAGIVVQRRYGRKPDGSVVVQTRVIQKRVPSSSARVTFGFGFERRSKDQKHESSALVKTESPDQETSLEP